MNLTPVATIFTDSLPMKHNTYSYDIYVYLYFVLMLHFLLRTIQVTCWYQG